MRREGGEEGGKTDEGIPAHPPERTDRVKTKVKSKSEEIAYLKRVK